MADIHKKVTPEYFKLVASGKKKFELRVNEFEINISSQKKVQLFGVDVSVAVKLVK